jgi:hypothetical protein
MSYEAPLRCQRCGLGIRKKPKAKTPKYCASCRLAQQDAWKDDLKNDRQRRARGGR